MSNTPSSPVVVRIQQSALIFVVLVLVLGALLLAANNIDPRASQRAGVNYVPWSSFNSLRSNSEKLISLEYPKGWEPQTNGLTYLFPSPTDQNTHIGVQLLRGDHVPLTKADANTPPDQLAKQLEQNLKTQSPTAGTITPITVGNLQGVLLRHTMSTTDPNTGTATNIDANIYILALDPTHVLFVLGQYPSDSSATNQPIVDHVVNSIHVELPAAIGAIDGFILAAATSQATGQATTQATVQATAQATQVATVQPTNSPVPSSNTPQPTASNTAKPTNTPQPTATNTAKPTNTPQPTSTNTPQPTATYTATATNTPKPTSTNTPVPTSTNTPTSTNSPVPPTSTPQPSSTPTIAPTNTPTLIPTATSGVATVGF